MMNVLNIRCQRAKGGLILISFFFSTSPLHATRILGFIPSYTNLS
jgi:hypothetical protein